MRPTTDRVRSALFNILARYGVEGARVADLFAGTGALGIEALSRGAQHADFVEADRRQAAVIRANLQSTGYAERARVLAERAEGAVDARRIGPCDLVLMDPPYALPFPAGLIAAVAERGVLAEDGILVCGHASRMSADDACGPLAKWDERRYGDSSLAFYSRTGEAPR